jgi:hypothetical protein
VEFDKLYAATGRRWFAPAYILRALLLQVLLHPFGVAVGEIGRYTTCYCISSSTWTWTMQFGTHAVFKERDLLLSSTVAQQFFSEISRHTKIFMSDEHFTWMAL